MQKCWHINNSPSNILWTYVGLKSNIFMSILALDNTCWGDFEMNELKVWGCANTRGCAKQLDNGTSIIQPFHAHMNFGRTTPFGQAVSLGIEKNIVCSL